MIVTWYRTGRKRPSLAGSLVVLLIALTRVRDSRAQPVRLPTSDGMAASAAVDRLPGKQHAWARPVPAGAESPDAVVTLVPPIDQPPSPVLPETADSDERPPLPPGARAGIFQRILFTGTWLPTFGGNDLGTTELDLSAVLGFPAPTRQSPLLVTPDFAVHYLDGPTTVNLPPRVYNASVEFRWMRKLSPRWAMDLAVQPGVFSDFRTGANDAVRVLGRGLAIYDPNPTTRLVFGVAHLARTDVKVLPIGGVIYTPNEDWRWGLLFPQPKISRRIATLAGRHPGSRWAYIAGEFGGGVWAIDPIGGPADTVTVRDFRLLLGVETKVPSGIGRRLELGYVFGRRIEFDSSEPDFKLRDTLLLRVGASY